LTPSVVLNGPTLGSVVVVEELVGDEAWESPRESLPPTADQAA
jgi:hypothetical protein